MAEPALSTVDIPAQSSSAQTPMRLYRAIMAAAGCVEVVLFMVAALGRVPLSVAVGAHIVLVSIIALLLGRSLLSGSDGGFALMGVLGTLATGPFGAFCAVMLPALSTTDDRGAARLAGWYERIALSAEQDDFTQVSDRIAIGRAANLAAPVPLELMQEFEGGSTAIQQSALGVIARNFHPDYLPILKVALDSPEPVVRVQAAAVAARVRENLKRDIGAMLNRAADPTLTLPAAQQLATELEMTAASGLLEQSARADAERTSAALRARVFARVDADYGRVSGQRPAAMAGSVANAYLARLLKDGRLADFRRARAVVHVPFAGRYRSRRIQLGQRSAKLNTLRAGSKRYALWRGANS